MLGAHSPTATQKDCSRNHGFVPSSDVWTRPSEFPAMDCSRSHGYVSFSDVLKRATVFPEKMNDMNNEAEEIPVMFAAPRESCRGLLAATYPLVFASPELQHSASVFLNSSFSTLSGYDPRPGTKKDLSGSVSSVTALVDSGADVHILSYEDALKMFLDVRPSALRVVGVNGSSTRAVCQGSLVVQVRAPSGTCHRIDLGTAHAMKSCPTNLLS